ncbi:MAG: hypothetical protein Q7T04_07945 [Dehalococcoidia bacterium]|nr:hypothetical protein [Dehalococcoidia bacterium]
MRYGDRQLLKAGYYLELATGRMVFISHLTMGDRRKRYIRIPAPLILSLGPILGFFYIIFLPPISIYVVATIVARRLTRMARAGGRAIGLMVAARREHDKGS